MRDIYISAHHGFIDVTYSHACHLREWGERCDKWLKLCYGQLDKTVNLTQRYFILFRHIAVLFFFTFRFPIIVSSWMDTFKCPLQSYEHREKHQPVQETNFRNGKWNKSIDRMKKKIKREGRERKKGFWLEEFQVEITATISNEIYPIQFTPAKQKAQLEHKNAGTFVSFCSVNSRHCTFYYLVYEFAFSLFRFLFFSFVFIKFILLACLEMVNFFFLSYLDCIRVKQKDKKISITKAINQTTSAS